MKNLLVLHKRKIGVIFVLLIFAFLCVPTVSVLAKEACSSSVKRANLAKEMNKCKKTDKKTQLPNMREIAKNAFNLKLTRTTDDHHYKITMDAEKVNGKTNPNRDKYCEQTFKLIEVNGVAYTGSDNELRCDHDLNIYVENLNGDTMSGLDGVVVKLEGCDVGRTVAAEIFEEDEKPCYYDSLTVELEYTVSTQVTHPKGCPVYETAIDTSEVDGKTAIGAINCDNPQTSDFGKAFCEARGQALKNEKAIKDIKDGKYSGPTIEYSCEYDVNKLPKEDDYNKAKEKDPDNYFLMYNQKKYLYGKYEFSVDTVTVGGKNVEARYKYEYDPGIEVSGNKVSCKIECEEVVEVEYGPPIAAKAGECFEYIVRVTSRVSCGMKELPGLPEPGPGGASDGCSYCDPYPTCYGYGKVWTQGGPNEDYDACVKSCDGGKYTKKCSKKCYNEVYGSNATAGAKIKNNQLDLTATKLDTKDDVAAKEVAYTNCVESKKTSLGTYQKSSMKDKLAECMCVGEIYAPDDNNYKYGCYFKDGKNIIWQGARDTKTRGTCYHPNSGLSKADSSNCTGIEGRWYTNHSGRFHNGSYILPSAMHDGFWRHVYNKSEEFPNGYCDDDCKWNDCRSGGVKYINPGYAERDYLRNMKLREEVIAQCQKKAVCNTTESTYTISADYKASGAATSQPFNFPEFGNDIITHNDGGKVTGSFENKQTTLLTDFPTKGQGRLGCYNQSDSHTDLYRATWGFPRAWINIKTAEISVEKESTGVWEEIPGRFCLPIDAGGVNIEWWNLYKSKYIEDVVPETVTEGSVTNEIDKCLVENTTWKKVKEKSIESDDIKYNIHAQTKDFGYFDWDIKIDCFYGVNPAPTVYVDDSSTTLPEDIPCKGDNDKQYEVRTVNLENMFPSTRDDAAKSSSETGSRTPGFNWSEYATIDETHGGEYTSNPKEYRETVEQQAKSEGIDYYNDSRLDYQFTITASELRALRRKSKESASYGSFVDGQFDKDKNGNYRYYSKIIRDDSIIKDKHVPGEKTKAITCNNMINYEHTNACAS